MNKIIKETTISGISVQLIQGDITREEVDVIVNAANRNLLHGGGVAGAIARIGGPSVQRESNEIAPIPTGSCGMTGSGLLPCKKVIHTVGPVWGEGEEKAKLQSAVQCALQLSEESGFQTISLPAISSGIFGYPKAENASVIWKSIQNFIASKKPQHLKQIRICIIDSETLDYFIPLFP